MTDTHIDKARAFDMLIEHDRRFETKGWNEAIEAAVSACQQRAEEMRDMPGVGGYLSDAAFSCMRTVKALAKPQE